MTKQELINRYSDEMKCSKKDAEMQVNCFFQKISDILQEDGSLRILGFGTFTTRYVKAREGRNPKNGQIIKIAARTAINFKAGQKLKNVVNGETSARQIETDSEQDEADCGQDGSNDSGGTKKKRKKKN